MSFSSNPFLLKNSFRTSICEGLYQDIITRRSNLYYFLGKTIEPNEDDIPLDIEDSIDEEFDIRTNIIGMKKVTASDVSFVASRYDWTFDTIYDMYDSTLNMKNKAYYVLTDNFDVYKCLDNNNNSKSTIKPSGTDINPIETSDGYIWKYMFSIPSVLRNKFMNDKFIPVSKVFTRQFYSDGAIVDTEIISAGRGYKNEPDVILEIDSETGSGGELAAIVDPNDGRIVSVRVVREGINYSDNDEVTITDFSTTPGSGALIKILTDSFGKIKYAFVKNEGIGYSSDIRTTIVVEGNGKDAKLLPVIEDGQIVDIIVDNPGSGYTFANIKIKCLEAEGAEAVAIFNTYTQETNQVIIEQTAIEGAIHAVKILNGGQGYSGGRFVIDGDGTGLELEPTIIEGVFKKINVKNVGSNYTYANIKFVGDGGGAEFKAVISPSGGHGSNAVEELGCTALCLYSSITQEKFNGLLVDNDFRQYGIIKDPQKYFLREPLTRIFSSSLFRIKLNSTLNLNKDDSLIINNNEYVILEIIASDVLVLGINRYDLINANDVAMKPGFSTIYTVSDVTSIPQVNRFSGEMLFVSNNPGINFSEEQFVSLKTYITL